MKLQPNIQSRSRRMSIPGFTLVEMSVSTGLYMVVFLGVMIAMQVFALRVYTLAATKLSATTGCLKAMNAIRDQIREAKTLEFGSCNSTPYTFSPNSTNTTQTGNALLLFQTLNTNNYTLYYLDTSTPTNYLRQFTVSTNGALFITNTAVLASYITNTDIFTAQDYTGKTLTNNFVMDNRMVVYMKLQFYQWEYPIAYVGGVNLNQYNSYQLQTRITRRATN